MAALNTDTRNYYKRLGIIGAIIALIIILMIIVTLPKQDGKGTTQTNNASQATIDLGKASAEVVKATLNLYYLDNGNYPVYANTVNEDSAINQESKDSYNKATTATLKDFDYSVKGDGKAYKFTYLSADGKTVEINGSYENEYH